MRSLAPLFRATSGAAAAEMALVTPLLVILLFGSVEVGRYFLDEHVVVKAVRDGARYAARQQLSNFVTPSGGCLTTPGGTVVDNTRHLVRTGQVSGGSDRLPYWTADTTVSVSVACFASRGGQSMTGIYDGITFGGAAVGAPVVTVSATVPYTGLFGFLDFGAGLNLRATQQAVVTGV